MLTDAAGDLLLGSHCVGCALPGRLLCPACAARLPGEPFVAWPRPAPTGLVLPVAAAPYADLVQALVLGHKERGLLALRRPLGGLLAGAVVVALAVAGVSAAAPVVLVPVPSRASTVRARGHDPTYAVCREAAAALRDAGHDVTVRRVLHLRGGVVDQSGLDAAARAANLTGSMACHASRLRALARHRPRAHVVVCDDVLTTGSTAREAQRALTAVGLGVEALAVVAATPRRHPPAG